MPNANTMLSDLNPDTQPPEETEHYVSELGVVLAMKAAECSLRAVKAAAGSAEHLNDDDHHSLSTSARRLNHAARILAGLEE